MQSFKSPPAWLFSSLGPQLLVLLFLASFTTAVAADEALEDELMVNTTRLRSLVLDGYVATVPPPGGAKVEIQLALYQMVEVSTPLQTIKFIGWWRHYWADRRLKWDASHWGVDALVFDFSEIWIPDDLIYEVIEDEPIGNAVVTVYADGNIFYSAPRVSTVGCIMELSSFPFDTQKCNFTVGSLAYDASFVDVMPRAVGESTWNMDVDPVFKERLQPRTAIDLQQFSPQGEYALTRVRIVSRNIQYACCVHPYPVIIFELEIKRETLTYQAGIIIPLISVTFVGFLGLLMPAPLSGARPTLAVSVAFTTSAIYLVVGEKLPDVGVWTLIGRLYLVSMGFSLAMTFVSILSTGVNLVIMEDKQHKNDMMAVFRAFDADKSGTLDREEVLAALNSIGLSHDDRVALLDEINFDRRHELTQDQWICLSEVARKYRASTQHSIVLGSILRWMSGTKKKEREIIDGEIEGPENEGMTIMGQSFGMERSDSNVELERALNVQMGDSQAADWVEGTTNGQSTLVFIQRQPEEAKIDDGEDDFSKVAEWLARLDLPEDVFFRFQEEAVDVVALSNLKAWQLQGLGVQRVGHQSKLLKWAKDYVTKAESRAAKAKPILKANGSSHESLGEMAGTETEMSFRKLPAEPRTTSGSNSDAKAGQSFRAARSAWRRTPNGSSSSFATRSPSFMKKHEIQISGAMKQNAKHLGAVIDWYTLILAPLIFMIYLICEFSGVFTDQSITLLESARNQPTKIELVDERAGTWEQMCWSNIPFIPNARLTLCENYTFPS